MAELEGLAMELQEEVRKGAETLEGERRAHAAQVSLSHTHTLSHLLSLSNTHSHTHSLYLTHTLSLTQTRAMRGRGRRPSRGSAAPTLHRSSSSPADLVDRPRAISV